MKHKKIFIIVFMPVFITTIGLLLYSFFHQNNENEFLEEKRAVEQINYQVNYIEQKIPPYHVRKEFFEDDIYLSYDSAILAWKESYILRNAIIIYSNCFSKDLAIYSWGI